MKNQIKLPALRGKIGDWFYYIAIMKFSEIANRTSMAKELHNNKDLREWIQRNIQNNRIHDIASYLQTQKQRFFNAIVCGIYDGKPSWQELSIANQLEDFSNNDVDFLNRTFGILTLSGEEKIFAIDGQHRIKAIQDVIKDSQELKDEEIPIIFVAHKTTTEGIQRTRRLFSTLNRYAKLVRPNEIIALDEEDNCAILIRELMDLDFYKGKILFNKNRSMPKQNTTHFTSIIYLYDLINILLTDKINKEYQKNIKPKGYPFQDFTSRRASEEDIQKNVTQVDKLLQEIIFTIPSLKIFFQDGYINRQDHSTNLVFRPIGQEILFHVFKIAMDNGCKEKALDFFARDNFNLENKIWNSIFWSLDTQTLITLKERRKYAVQLILTYLDIPFDFSQKEQTIFNNFNSSFKIDPKNI